MIPGKAEPRFDHDYEYGRQGELRVRGTVEALRGGQVQVEDKRKRRLDNKFYVELQDDPGRRGVFKPSGLSVSTSEVWAFVIADTGVVLFVPADRLRRAVEAGLGKPAEETDGSCPTRGRLLSFGEILATGLNP